jgi:hypothetical protein
MKLKLEDLDRLEKLGIGGGVTYEEQIALIKLAKEKLNGSFDSILNDMSFAVTASIWCILLAISGDIVSYLVSLSQLFLIFTVIRIAIRIFKGFKNQ